MQFDYTLRRQAGMPGYVGKVRPKVPSVADRDLDHPLGKGRRVSGGREPFTDQGLNFVVGAQARLEIDQYGGVRGMQVQDAANPLKGARQQGHLAV